MKTNRYDRWVESLRPAKQPPSMDRPVAAFIEREVLPDRTAGDVLTVILNNRECPYRCVFCGLWKDTIDDTPLEGAVAHQVAIAIKDHSRCDAIKLYNAGSFFDEQAIPAADREHIARLCGTFRWVIVESRPELINVRAVEFASMLEGRLQIAIGLEIANDEILALLNKRMTLASIRRAGEFVRKHSLSWRAFIMVQPPFVSPGDAFESACRTATFAEACGADTLSYIRTYETPGAMQTLARSGFWAPPEASAVYDVASWSLTHCSAVTLVDGWSIGHGPLRPCCASQLSEAFRQLNETQTLPPVRCGCRTEVNPMAIRGPREYRSFLLERQNAT